jgi:magnesium transporter
MKYPENTAGSLMHPEFVKLTPRMTARQALLSLQAIMRPGQKEYLYALYVIDEAGKVVGALTLQDLVSAPPDEQLYEMMSSVEMIKIKPQTDQEEVSKLFSKYQINSAPVVDDLGQLIGVLTVSDIISVMRQEASEDIAKMAGTEAADLGEHSVFRVVRMRMPWLVVTIFGGIFSAYIIKSYEGLLMQVIALASFSPIIAAMGGSVGSQSATIVVRSIALGQVNGHQKLKTIFREMRVGLIFGLTYGTFLGIVAYLFYGQQYTLGFAVVVGMSMCISVTIAATLGAIEPIIFERFGIDPATATGPVITTITDILTIFSYFTLATALLLR